MFFPDHLVLFPESVNNLLESVAYFQEWSIIVIKLIDKRSLAVKGKLADFHIQLF